MSSSVYDICAFCDTNSLWCDASFGGFPCTRCRSMRKSCCARGKVPMSYSEEVTSHLEFATAMESESCAGGMVENPQVHLTRPLDNLVAELNDFLGLGPGGAPTSRIPVLPHFIQSMAEGVPEEDLEYLQSKGVFSLPGSMLCRELLRAFVESVYPFLPVLDLASFLRAVISQGEADDDSQPVSLLLFHAVMFSATAFVDMKHLHNAGYATRKDAREQFYLRARALYDFDVENDRLVLIQALLLMTYWHESPDNPKDSQYWLNVCWSLGASIGLDHNPSGAAISAKTQKVWKRVWWCLYTRDALLALNLRRPLSCQKESSGLSVVGLEDFDIGRYAQRIVAALGGCTLLEDIRVQQNLAVGFIEKAKLCVLIYEVLALRDAQGTTPSSPVMRPPSGCSIEETARRLERWSNELPVQVQYAPLRAEDLDLATTRLLHVQRSWIRVLFLATIGTLHRQSTAIQRKVPSSPSLNHLHPQYDAVTSQIASILQELNQLCLVQHLPTTTVALLVPVLLRQVLVFGTHTGSAQVGAFELFYKAMQVLGALGDVYSFAVVVRRFFEETLRGAAVAIPTAIQSLLTEDERGALLSLSLGRLRGNI